MPPGATPALTLLAIAETGIPPYSARGVTQTLEPIRPAAIFQRTVNGVLVSLSPPQMQKYRSTISCDDQDPPNLDGFWPGDLVTVSCVAELGMFASGANRPVVDGSIRSDGQGNSFYRPILTMLITGFRIERDEWGAAVRWQMDLEEL